ncbi:MAG: hypothetical protein HKN76_07260 [Saprospiraceae bacterium]|nr:hypothetical protein [Saprospiraceae bacterium]
MRKRICQFINFRHLLRTKFSLLLIAAMGINSSMHAATGYDGYPVKEIKEVNWTNGTLVDGVQVIELDWSILEQPADPMVGDSICFEFVATNLCENDTLQNVMILKEAVKIASAMTLLPNGVMAGSGVNPFTGSGTFTLTGSGCKVLTAQDIDNGFVVCPATAMGFKNGEPAADCVDAMACFDVTLSCTDYNISLDAECETLLTPELLDIKTAVPDSLLRIRIQEGNGSFRDEPMVDAADVGSKVKVVVDIPGCPDIAPCWSYAHIEYKLGPALICNIDTVSCAMQVGMNDPVITVACGSTQLIRGQTIRENLCQVSQEFLAKETTTFAVVDQFGNGFVYASALHLEAKLNVWGYRLAGCGYDVKLRSGHI